MHADKLATVEVKVGDAKDGAWFAYDPTTRMALVPKGRKTWTEAELRQGICYEVPPSSLGMLLIADEKPEPGFAGETREAEVRSRFEARRREAQAAGDIAALRDGTLEVNWADIDGDGNAEIRIASKEQELGIGPSGNLWAWKVRGHGEDLVNRFDGGGVGADQYWWPDAARSAQDKSGEYELVTREIKGGRATVVFRRELSHWALGGLVIEKTYTIAEGAPKFGVRVTLRNESPEVHEVSYWSHNCFRIGDTPALTLLTTEGKQTFAGEQQPREVWALRSGLSSVQNQIAKKPNVAPLAQPSFVLGAASGPQIVVTVDPATLLQVYRWWDGTKRGRYTLEWMYQKAKLSTNQIWTTRFEVALRRPSSER